MEFEHTTSPCPDVVRDEVRWLVAKYSFALLCVTLATWIRLELAEILGDRMPFGTYFLAVFIAAWLGGAGPGLLCLAGSIVAAAHFIVEPANSLFISEPAPLLSLLVFGLVGTVTILLFHGLARKSELASESFRRIELLNQRLTAADRAKDEFISVLAHELRNPLAPMQSAAELLQHPAVSPTQVAATGKLYARHLAHMRHLVDDLFDVSRYLRGQLNLQWEIVDLRQPIGNAVEFINAALEEKSLVLKILLPPEPLMLRVDPVRITQAVANLLVNAVKFTPHGGSITLLVERSGNEAKIMVKDSGIGIDPSMHNMIFEPFNQVVPGRARLNGGLGLGLTLVKKVIELHGGKVAVASAGLGRGSCFTISLPILHQPTPELPPAAPACREEMGPDCLEATQPTARVLIVDDNQDAANTLAALLKLNGYQPDICHDGFAALQAFRECKPTFILLDIGLPNMDGYEVASRIQQLDPSGQSTIISVTGWGGEEHKHRSRAAGIQHHLVKPVLLKQLLPLLAAAPRAAQPVVTLPPTNDGA